MIIKKIKEYIKRLVVEEVAKNGKQVTIEKYHLDLETLKKAAKKGAEEAIKDFEKKAKKK